MRHARRSVSTLVFVAMIAACGGGGDADPVASSDTTEATEADATTSTTEAERIGEGEAEPDVTGEVVSPDYAPIEEQPEGEQRTAFVGGFAAGEPAVTDAPASDEDDAGVQSLSGGVASACQNCSGFAGLWSIYQQDNFAPGVDSSRSCGQAAVATMLTYYGKMPQDDSGGTVTQVWNSYPPNVPGDGTNWDQVQNAMVGYGMSTYWGTGLAEMKTWLKTGQPVILMVDVGAVGPKWGAHWIVAYAYDSGGIYVTNWNGFGTKYSGHITNAELKKAWGNDPNPNVGWIVKGAGVANRFLLARP